jgi:DUF2934 family protein
MSRRHRSSRNRAAVGAACAVAACPGVTPVEMPSKTNGDCASASRDAIEMRAHEIWERLGRPEGRDLDIWLTAENELHPA